MDWKAFGGQPMNTFESDMLYLSTDAFRVYGSVLECGSDWNKSGPHSR